MNGLIQSKKQLEKLKKIEQKQREIDEFFMEYAIMEAKKALESGEIPVGAIIVKNGEIIASGKNEKEQKDCAIYHAEINAIIAASKKLGWRLEGCEMYVTLEPCAMCAGAIVSSRIERVVFGASEQKSGCFKKIDKTSDEKIALNGSEGSAVNVFEQSGLNFKTKSAGGVLEDKCADLLKRFFEAKRKIS